MENINSKICPNCLNEYPKKTIICEQCNITLMKKSTYNRIYNNYLYKIYVCPKCKKYYYPPVSTEKCDDCSTKLITNDEYSHTQINKSKNFNTVFTIICTIIAIIVLIFLISIFTTPSSSNSRTCKRCDKTFTDSDNTWSIAYSGFCEKCHDDFEYISNMQN